ncbi:MAG: hypothetical protein AAGM16_00645 [Pseudomonadota bacterium]
MAKKQTNKPAASALAGSDGNVDQIREILFGGQMRDYEQRFADLEDRLTRSIELLTSNIEKRVDRLDAFAKRELDKLGGQIKEERANRRKEGKAAERELKTIAQRSESWHAELSESLDDEAQALRVSVQEQGDELSGMISDVHEQLSQSLSGEARILASSKLARDDLADMLAEMALRLKKDFELPDA